MIRRTAGLLIACAILPCAAIAPAATMVPGGKSGPDCIVELSLAGLGFPSGKLPQGATCYDGDACDMDGVRNGVCAISASICINVQDPRVKKCKVPFTVSHITFSGPKSANLQVSQLQSATSELGMPSSASNCTTAIGVTVPLRGIGKDGIPQPGKLKIEAKAKTQQGKTD